MAQSNPAGFLLFLIFLFLVFSPSGPPVNVVDQQDEWERVIAQETASLDVLRNSTYGDFVPNDGKQSRWLNLTGLRQEDQLQWNLLPQAQERARAGLEVVAPEQGLNLLDGKTNGSLLLYKNVTGYLHGEWIQGAQGNRTNMVNLTAIVPNGYSDPSWGRNITGQEGKISMRLTEHLPKAGDGLDDRVRPLSARLTIQDETSSGDGWAMAMSGVHFSDTGSIVLTTTSEKFAGIFATPHFALSEHSFEPIQALVNRSITRTIQAQMRDTRNIDQNPWSSLIAEDFPSQPLCDFVVYLQQQPLKHDAAPVNNNTSLSLFDELENLENDLRFPSGLYLQNPPKLSMSMVAYSPDCGFIIESKGPPSFPATDPPHLQGPKLEVYVRQTKTVMVFFMIVFASQLLLLSHQMKASSTPSTRSRISYTTLSMLNMGSGFAAFGFLMLSSFVESVFLDSMILAFFAFLDGNYIGMRFVLDVWTAQEPERLEVLRAREREIAAAVASFNARMAARVPVAVPTSPPEDSLPLPVTAPHPSNPTLASTPTPPQPTPLDSTQPPPPNTTQQTPPPPTPTPTTPLPTHTPLILPTPPPLQPPQFSTLYARFSFTLLILVFLSLSALTSFPLLLRTLYTNTLVTLYLSLWLPQVHRNILRNTRKPLLWRFVLGQSTLRLLPVGYFWTVEGNVLDARTDRVGFAVLVGWVVLQVGVLGSQCLFGPRWCVSEGWSWVPEAWEWRPVLREGDEERGLLPVGGSVVVKENGGEGEHENGEEDDERVALNGKTVERAYDCAICMQSVRVPIVAARSNTSPQHENGHEGSSYRHSEVWWARLLRSAVRKIQAQRSSGTSTGMDEEDYAITPCRHVFHWQCIAGWLQYRSMCPICRTGLPSM